MMEPDESFKLLCVMTCLKLDGCAKVKKTELLTSVVQKRFCTGTLYHWELHKSLSG